MQAEYQDPGGDLQAGLPENAANAVGDRRTQQEDQGRIDIVRRSAEGSYKAALAQEASVHARLESAKKAVLDLQGRSIQYNILKRDVETNRQFYDGLLSRYKEVGVSGGQSGSTTLPLWIRRKCPGHPTSQTCRRI